MKTTFIAADNYVTMHYFDNLERRENTRIFHVPHCGGFVREGDMLVCEGLASVGFTLYCEKPDKLIDIIRREFCKLKYGNRKRRPVHSVLAMR